MPVIGMNIRNITAKKYEGLKGPVKVNSNVNLKDVKKQNLPLLNKNGLSIDFEFKTQYLSKNKTIGEIVIEGNVIFIDPQQDKILKGWEKDKKLPDDTNLEIINTILRRSFVKALNLSEELQLPPPIALPFARKREESKYIG